MKKRIYFSLMILLSLALFACEDSPATLLSQGSGTFDDPLIIRGYADSNVIYEGRIGKSQLYVVVVNIPYYGNNHSVTLTNLNDNVDLHTFSDAFFTLEDSSQAAGTTNESCDGTTTADGKLYILIDGTVASTLTTFTLTAGT